MSDNTEKLVSCLEKMGFQIDREYGDGEVWLSRKKGATTFYATVQPGGNINGEPAEKFIEWVKSYQ